MSMPWLEHYDPGVPRTIGSSIGKVLRRVLVAEAKQDQP